MKKQRAWAAWGILLGSLPRGIAAFVVAVAGICIGLPLAVFFVGLPVLAATLIGCKELMTGERRLISAWESGDVVPNAWQSGKDLPSMTTVTTGKNSGVWRGWLAPLTIGYNYRGLVYGFLQLPIGIAAFTIAVVIPFTALGLTLSPLADYVSGQFFSFELFAGDWFMNHSLFFSDWSSFERAWLVAGIGAILFLLTPPLLRMLGRCYAAWINWIAGPINQTKSEPAV